MNQRKGVSKKKMKNWFAEPFYRSMEYIQEIERVNKLCVAGISSLRGMDKLSEALLEAELGRQNRKATKSERNELQERRKISAMAKSECHEGFPILHSHALISIWGALEVLIDDLVLSILLNVPNVLNEAIFAKVKIPLAKFETLERNERMTLLVDELKRELKTAFKPAVVGFEVVLGQFGLSGQLDDNLKRTLMEMQQIRNVLVHRSGIFDEKASRTCPWMDWKIGKKVKLSGSQINIYVESVIQYMTIIAKRPREHLMIPPASPVATEIQPLQG
jgi:hypothetical protein